MPKLLITTLDNPFNPFTEREAWLSFDTENGYFTDSLLARIALTSNELSEEDYSEAINDAVKTIFRLNFTGNYKIVSENDEPFAGVEQPGTP